MSHCLLIVEDDAALREGLTESFCRDGYEVRACGRGDAVVPACREARPDLILLDLMLPRMHGLDVCRALREEGMMSPIIMLTALADERQVIEGLKSGADDYIVKPFRLAELKARVEAQLRRVKGDFRQTLSLDDHGGTLDLARGEILRNGERARLTRLETQVLELLIRRRPGPVSRDELLREVWGYKGAVETRSVDMAMSKLRAKLETDPANPTLLVTVREQGYSLRLPGEAS